MHQHDTAFLDWLAVARGGWDEPATRAARALGDGLLEQVTALGTSGHVLDFDDTFPPGLAHLSAPTAPAALVVGSELDRSVEDVIEAYAAGFEAMGAMTKASGSDLYARGWHPTAVCGVVGSAVAAGHLLELDPEGQRSATALALLRAAGLQAAFGSDGKALQVGMSAAAGVAAAKLAAGGASASLDEIAGAGGFEGAFAAQFSTEIAEPAAHSNWLKPWPCCLQTHPAIEGALEGCSGGPPSGERLIVKVPPLARVAARYDDVETGHQAKFSIPYVTAMTMLRGSPTVASFDRVDDDVRAFANERISVSVDPGLGKSEAVLLIDGEIVTRVKRPRGCPERPMDAEMFAAKVYGLAGDRFDGAVEPGRGARALLETLRSD